MEGDLEFKNTLKWKNNRIQKKEENKQYINESGKTR